MGKRTVKGNCWVVFYQHNPHISIGARSDLLDWVYFDWLSKKKIQGKQKHFEYTKHFEITLWILAKTLCAPIWIIFHLIFFCFFFSFEFFQFVFAQTFFLSSESSQNTVIFTFGSSISNVRQFGWIFFSLVTRSRINSSIWFRFVFIYRFVPNKNEQQFHSYDGFFLFCFLCVKIISSPKILIIADSSSREHSFLSNE